MQPAGHSGKFSTLATGILVVCALVIAALALRSTFPPTRGLAVTREESWRQYADAGHWDGPHDAPVVMVVFADFQCPACRVLHASTAELRRRYPRDLAFVHRHRPLPMHAYARMSEIASECAASQSRFLEMQRELYSAPDSIGRAPWHWFALKAGVPSLDAFDRCIVEATPAPIVERDNQVAESAGIRGTPTVYMNGVRFSGAPSLQTLDSLVRAAVRERTLSAGVLRR